METNQLTTEVSQKAKKKKPVKKVNRVTDNELKAYEKFIREDVNEGNLNEFLRVFNIRYGSESQIYKDLRNLLRLSSKAELEMRAFYKSAFSTSLTEISSKALSDYSLGYLEKDDMKKLEYVKNVLCRLNLFGIHITELLNVKALAPKHSNEISLYFMKSFQGLTRYMAYLEKRINGVQQPDSNE